MSFDPRRALVGLAMAGSLIIAPPAVGYAVGLSHGSTDQHVRALHQDSETGFLKHNNDNAAHVNDNAAPVANDTDDGIDDNVSAGAYQPPPYMPASSSGAAQEDSANNNNPNNSDSPG